VSGANRITFRGELDAQPLESPPGGCVRPPDRSRDRADTVGQVLLDQPATGPPISRCDEWKGRGSAVTGTLSGSSRMTGPRPPTANGAQRDTADSRHVISGQVGVTLEPRPERSGGTTVHGREQVAVVLNVDLVIAINHPFQRVPTRFHTASHFGGCSLCITGGTFESRVAIASIGGIMNRGTISRTNRKVYRPGDGISWMGGYLRAVRAPWLVVGYPFSLVQPLGGVRVDSGPLAFPPRLLHAVHIIWCFLPVSRSERKAFGHAPGRRSTASPVLVK